MRFEVNLTADGFALARGRRNVTNVTWTDIAVVEGENVSKITYDEVFLIVRSADVAVSVGELDLGFAAFGSALLEHLQSFPADWYVRIDMQPPGNRVILWEASTAR